MKIACAYTYIPEHKALHWPSDEDRASLMERTSVSALRAGMVIPVLQYGGIDSFATLVEPERVLCGDGRTSGQFYAPLACLQKPGMHTRPPPYLTFKARTTTYSVVVMADAAIRGNIWEQHVLAALRAIYVPLTAPDMPLAHRLFSPGAPPVWSTRCTSARRQSLSTTTSCPAQ